MANEQEFIKQTKELIDSLDENSILLLHGLITGEHQTEFNEDMRFIV